MKIKENPPHQIFYETTYYLRLDKKKSLYPMVILEESYLLLGDQNGHFIIEISKEDLENFPYWNFIWEFYQINLITLSQWWHSFFLQLKPEGIFASLNWSNHYKTREEWKEWATFQKNSEILLKYYDFPIQTIRLWDRLEENIQELWLEILNIFKIKKNLLKEIIHDIYDLNPEIRAKATLECLEIAKTYLSKKLSIFPQEEIREKIQMYRYPLSYNRRKESYKLKKRIEHDINLKNFQIILPNDLESQPIELRIFFKNQDEVEEFIKKFCHEKTKRLFLDLIEYVFQK